VFGTVIGSLNQAFGVTLRLFAVTLIGALPLGLLVSFGSMSKWSVSLGKWKIRPVRSLFQFVVWLFRGSPLMLQLMIIFYVPGMWGRNIWAFSSGRFWAAATAFILNYACYFSEIYRGGIESISKGQDEAGLVLGMTKSQIFFRVKLMQMLRRIVPPMANEIITLVKDTALANVIALTELIFAGERFLKNPGITWPLFFTGVYYLAFNGVLTLLFGWIEKKLSFYKM